MSAGGNRSTRRNGTPRAGAHGGENHAQRQRGKRDSAARQPWQSPDGGTDSVLEASARLDHARSGSAAIAPGDDIELGGELSQTFRGGAEDFRGGAPGLRQHLGFEKIADAPGFLFECADNVFEIFHWLLTRPCGIFRYYRDAEQPPQGIRMPLPPQLRWKLERWQSRLKELASGEDRPKRPQLCPSCGQLVGAEQNRCGACGTSMTFSLAAASRGLAGIMPQPHPVTKLVMGLNFIMFLITMVATYAATQQLSILGRVSGQVLFRLGARDTYDLVARLQWWRLVMPIFLHGSLLHIGMNTWVLLDMGPALEELYGSSRFLFLYVATGIFGFVFSTGWDLIWGHIGSSVGASGAILGLVGLQLAISGQRGGAYFQMMRRSLIQWIIIIFAFGFFMGGIDNAAHFGGLVSGYLLGRIFTDREPADAVERRRATLLALVALGVVVASFAAMILHYSESLS